MGAGLQWVSLQRMVSSLIDPTGTTTAMVGAISLLAAAVGPWLPVRVALGVTQLINRRRSAQAASSGVEPGTFWMLRALRDQTPSLTWLSFSILAAIAGAGGLFILMLSRSMETLLAYLLQRFFWTDLTLTLLDWLSTVALIGPLFLLLGLLWAAAARLGTHRSGEPRPIGPMLSGTFLGLGLGVACADIWTDRGLAAEQLLLIGVMLMFVLAGASAVISLHSERIEQQGDLRKAEGPELTSGGEGRIWVCLVVWGVAAVLAGAGWTSTQHGVEIHNVAAADTGAYLLLIGIGAWAACWHVNRGQRSGSGCGMATWAAGIGAGIAVLLLVHGGGRLAHAFSGMALGLPLGYSLQYIRRAWMARAGSRTRGWAQLAGGLWAGCAVGTLLAGNWLLPMLGPIGTLTTASLLMLAFGGLVQIYERDRPTRVQNYRLAAIFMSLAAALLLFPHSARQWSERRTPAMTARIPSTESLARLGLPPIPRVCVIGTGTEAVEQIRSLGAGRIHVFPATARREDRLPAEVGPITGLVVSDQPPSRAFRTLRVSYDLIYQYGDGGQADTPLAGYTAEWLARLADRTVPGGWVVVDVPLDSMSRQGIKVLVETLRSATGGSIFLSLETHTPPTVVRLAARVHTPFASLTSPSAGWRSADKLADEGERARVHSLRRDSLRTALRSAEGQRTSLPAWLEGLTP